MMKDVFGKLKKDENDNKAVAYLEKRFPQIIDWGVNAHGVQVSVESDALTKMMHESQIEEMKFDDDFKDCQIVGSRNGADVERLKKWMVRHKVWLLYKYGNQKAHFQKIYEVA